MPQPPRILTGAQKRALRKYIEHDLFISFRAMEPAEVLADIEALLADPSAPPPSTVHKPLLDVGEEVAVEGKTYVVVSTTSVNNADRAGAPEIALFLELREKGTRRRRDGVLLRDGTVEVLEFV